MKWGPWSLNRDGGGMSLQILVLGRAPYDVPVRQLNTPEGREKWLFHLQEKNWFTPDVEGHYRDAVRTLTSTEGGAIAC